MSKFEQFWNWLDERGSIFSALFNGGPFGPFAFFMLFVGIYVVPVLRIPWDIAPAYRAWKLKHYKIKNGTWR